MRARWIVRSRPLLLLAIAVLVGACSPKTPEITFEPKVKWTTQKPIDDLKEMPQDTTAYLDKTREDTPLLDPQTAKMREEGFIDRLFGPWRCDNPAYARKSAMRSMSAYSRNPGYDDLGQPHTKAWADAVASNANLRFFDKSHRPAITVANTNLRAIPTMDHRFGTPGKPGQGYPFDLLQVSALWVGTPVVVDHLSRDGAWALVETAIAPGWVRTEDLAYVDEVFMTQYLAKPFVAFIAEDVPLLPGPGKGLRAGVGVVLPTDDSDGVRLRVQVPAAGPGGHAQTQPVWVTQGQAALMPLAATPANIARTANQMLGQPYGWGGLDGKRDCSATTRDALAPFGLWLPRNSASQAKSGVYISLEGMTGEEKEQAILKNGVPYLTLIWMPGHILLYIGQYKGHPAVFHEPWGLRTLDPDGSEGRRVIGKTVITTLRVGEIYPEVGPDRILLNRVRGMTLVAPETGKECVVPEDDTTQDSQ
jgi:hypothetical protein